MIAKAWVRTAPDAREQWQGGTIGFAFYTTLSTSACSSSPMQNHQGIFCRHPRLYNAAHWSRYGLGLFHGEGLGRLGYLQD